MIDHVSLGVGDLERASDAYERMLAPLGLTRVVVRPNMIGFGKTYPEIWLNRRAGMTRLPNGHGAHICLRARGQAEVVGFHAAAIEAGMISESGPMMRPHDRLRYYAAFVVDADGNRIEAVTFPQD